jgi:two-component system response regulator AtoC
MTSEGRVLVVDDDAEMCALIETGLKKRGWEVVTCTSADSALERLGAEDVDVVATDLNMRGMNGLELCERVVANRPDIPVVVLTAFGSMESAVAAIRAGAYDFITKPFDMEMLRLTVTRAARHRSLEREVKRLRQAAAAAGQQARYEEILGASSAMKRVYELLDRVAETDASVLITGESGTGKEVVARALHQKSKRAAEPFVPVNCAAVPEPLLESELFGHVKGAFTDARSARPGLFVKANRGTLFLDEIGELPLALQPKLLRALQERVVRPVGSDTEVPFDVRLITATNRDLETAAEERRFREDLFYRINVIHVALPPLRARGSDVLLLAQHFVEHHAKVFGKAVTGVATPAAEKLVSYGWPGNVRELQNCMERAVALTRFAEISVDDLPDKIRDYKRTQLVLAGDDPAELVPMAEIERRYILRVLEAVGGSKTIAAQTLGMDRKTLYRKLEQYAAQDRKHDGSA